MEGEPSTCFILLFKAPQLKTLLDGGSQVGSRCSLSLGPPSLRGERFAAAPQHISPHMGPATKLCLLALATLQLGHADAAPTKRSVIVSVLVVSRTYSGPYHMKDLHMNVATPLDTTTLWYGSTLQTVPLALDRGAAVPGKMGDTGHWSASRRLGTGWH